MADAILEDDAPVVDDRLRTAIHVPGHIIDLSLVSKVPIAHVVSHLIPYLKQQLSKSGNIVKWLSQPEASWHLERFGHMSLDPEKTLEQEGLLDGDSLYLVPTSPSENYPALIDDVAESIAYNQKRNFPVWDNDHAVKMALIVIQVITAITAVTAVGEVYTTTVGFNGRYIFAGILAAVAFGVMAMSATITKSESNRLNKITGPLALSGYMCLAAAALLVIPREMDIYQLSTMSAVLFAAAFIMYSITKEHVRMHYTVSTASLIATVVFAINLLYRSPVSVICVQLILLSTAVILISSRVAMSFAKIILERVPATGESYLKGDPLDLSSVGRTPGSPGSPGSSQAIESVINQEKQVLVSYNVIDGLLSGSLLVMVIAALFAGLHLDNHNWIIWSFMLVMSACLIYRGKSYDDARRQTLCLYGAIGVVLAFTIGLMFSPEYAYNNERVAINFGIILFGLLVGSVYAIQHREINSPIIMKLFEYVERVLFSSLVVYLMVVMDLYQKVRAL